MRIKLVFVVLALLALALASACGSDDGSKDSASPTSDASGEPAGQPGEDAPTVSMDTSEIAVGERDEAVLAVLNFNAPGLGAWTVDIKYDTSIVSVIACEPLPEGTSVCNENFADDAIRVVGAVGVGLEGNTVIGRITFQCDVAGESRLDLLIDTFADGTIGNPQELVPFVENGTITCTE